MCFLGMQVEPTGLVPQTAEGSRVCIVRGEDEETAKSRTEEPPGERSLGQSQKIIR